MLGDIVYILVSEIMGYSAVLYDTNTLFDEQIVSAAAGCQDADDLACKNRDFENPIVHFTIETWDRGHERATSLSESIRPVLLGIQSYDLEDEWYLWPDVLLAGFNSPSHLSLDYYRYYNASSFSPHVFFDTYSEVLELLPPSVLVRCSSMDADSSAIFRNTRQYTRATGDAAVGCINDTVWLSPSCRAAPATCVPLMLQYNFDRAMQLASFLDMPLAIFMVGPGPAGVYAEYYAAAGAARLLFGWYQPDDSLLDAAGRLPVLLNLPRTNEREQAAGLYRTGFAQASGRAGLRVSRVGEREREGERERGRQREKCSEGDLIKGWDLERS